MSNGDEPIRPRPPAPGQPLPRLWKVEPEPEEEPDPATDRKSKRSREKEEKKQAKKPKAKITSKPKSKEPDRKASKPAEGAKGKGVLLEETPELDTYESRQRVRLLIGGLLSAAGIFGLFMVYRTFQAPSSDEEGLVDEGAVATTTVNVPAPPPTPDKSEQEAKNLLGTARQLAKNNKTKEASVILERVVKSYPKSVSATIAKAALSRPTKNLPLFVDEDMVLASPTSKSKTTPPSVVNAVDSNVTLIAPNSPGEATLQLNPNPSEAPRAPSDSSTTKSVTARPLPAGFRMEADSGVHASGWPYQIISDRDGAIMVLVPAGTYTQGRDNSLIDEGPAHKVKLNAYYVDQHEVTNRQHELYLKETGRRRVPVPVRPLSKDEPTGAHASEEEPMTNLTALEAKAYCEWAGKKLPTEAQWEAAARSTDARLYPWGSTEPVWSRPRAPRQIDPVGSYPLDQSPSGALDLAGNAWEWTRDYFDSKYYQQLRGQVADNPTGPATSRARPAQVVVKGGSKKWDVTWREGLKVESKLPFVGFRGVLTLENTDSGVTPPQPPTTQPATNSRPPANASGVVPF